MDYIKAITGEEDYIERAGALEEITVTITICEYRELIQYKARAEMQLEQLTKELEQQRQHNEKILKALLAKSPDVMSALTDAVHEMFGADEEDE